MADIVYISKYPPLEGGIAAKTFWLTRSLARAGHTIHIVTDPLNIDTVHSIPEGSRPPASPGVTVHRAEQDIPWHIPNDSHGTISLLDKTLEVTSRYNPDLIVGAYLIPYGIVASEASRLTDIPCVLLHGGSDINKFLLKKVWPHVLAKTLGLAHCVITDADNQEDISRYTDRTRILPPYVPDPSAFRSGRRTRKDTFSLALIGKANYFWHQKGWQQVVNTCSTLGEEFELNVVSQGVGLEDFKRSVPGTLLDKVSWQPFVPPWEMPTLLHALDGIFFLKDQLPFPMFSNLVLESLSCGCSVITDSSDLLSSYQNHGIDIETGASAIYHLSSEGEQSVATNLAEFLAKLDVLTSWDCTSAFDHYVATIERVFLDAIDENKRDKKEGRP